MIHHSNYWIDATALEPLNNHEIVVLEKDKNGFFTVRHANQPEDWLYNQAAYINNPLRADEFNRPLPTSVHTNEVCRCLIVDITMK